MTSIGSFSWEKEVWKLKYFSFRCLKDGDFLVRESQGSPGQYVLTGMQSGHHKHLLLVDPEGVVSLFVFYRFFFFFLDFSNEIVLPFV